MTCARSPLCTVSRCSLRRASWKPMPASVSSAALLAPWLCGVLGKPLGVCLFAPFPPSSSCLPST